MSILKKLQQQEQLKRKEVVRKLSGQGLLYAGDPALQWGIGGWARAKLNLMYGPEKSGKSTILLKAAAEEQKKTGGIVVIFDSEYAYDAFNHVNDDGTPTEDNVRIRSRMQKMGLDTDKVYVFCSNIPNVLFENIGLIEKALKSGEEEICSIIVDSLGALQSDAAREKIEKGDLVGASNSYGGIAKIIAQISLTMTRLVNEYGVTGFMVQHCIQNMDMYGDKWILLGGQKLRYMMHNIVFVESVKAKDAGLLADGTTTGENADGIRVGKKIRFKCEKSRNVVEGRKGEFWFNFENGEFAKPEVSLFELATSLKIIDHPVKDGKVNKMWWEYPVGAPTPIRFQGGKACIEMLSKDKDLFNAVFNDCMKSNNNNALSSGVDVSTVVDFGSEDE
jgi:RecA/RadA recombinase